MKRTDQKGFGLIEALIILVVLAVLGFVGAMVWGRLHTPDKEAEKTSKSVEVATPEKTNSTDTPTKPQPDTTAYLEIKEWGVKMAIPQGLSGVVYGMKTERDIVYLGTGDTEALGGACLVSQNGVGAVSRYQTKLTEDMGSRPSPINNEKPINGYYYYYSHPQALCSYGQAGAETIETAAVSKIQSMAFTLQAK